MPRIYTTTPPEERFWKHVDKNGPIPPLHPELGNCWLWMGSFEGEGEVTWLTLKQTHSPLRAGTTIHNKV